MRKKPIAWLLVLSICVSFFNFSSMPKVSAASAIDFQDDFSDGDFTASPTWTVAIDPATSKPIGTWSIAADPTDTNNKVLNQSDTGEGIITTGENWDNSTVTMRIYTGNGGAYPGILARVQDYKNFYYFQMQTTTGVVLSKRINGTDTTIKTVSYTLSKNKWYTLKLVLNGSSIRGYVVENGVDKLLFDAVDSTYSSGKIGIRNKWQAVQVDDVKVIDIPAANASAIKSDEAAKTTSSVSLSWDTIDGASSYNVYRSTTSGSGYTFVGNTTDASYVNTGLNSDTVYYYKIAYLYGGLTESQWSSELSVRTVGVPPVAPTGQTAVAADSTTINLNWTATATATGYRVLKSSDGGESFDQIYEGTALSFKDTGLTPNKEYRYQFKAFNAFGESPAASAQASTFSFDAPTGFTASSTTSSVTLNWDALEGTKVTYTLKKSPSASGTYTTIYTGTDTTYTDTGLTQGTGYFYKLSAVADGVAAPESTPLGISATRTAIVPSAIWTDTTGLAIDAHGAGFMYDEKTQKYYWYGEYHKGAWPSGGVRVYSSTDLLNWKDEGMALSLIQSKDDFTNVNSPVYDLYKDRTDTDNIWADIRKGRIVERPKVVYNDETKKYVMWAHIDGDKNADNDAQNYGKAQAGVAISDSPTGPFVYQRSYRMDMTPAGQTDYHPSDKGMARDMNLFKDDDGTAYLIYSSEENLTIYISKLTPDYLDVTGWHKDGLTDEDGNPVRDTSYKSVYGVDYVRVFPGAQREAPAMFKYKGKYYMITSGATGWAANQNKYTVADNIFGTWSPMTDPFVRTSASDPDPTKAFNTQSTFVIPVDAEAGKFIYVGDIWNGGNFANDGAKYVFLPIEFGMGTDIAIKWYSSWTTDLLDAMGQVNVTTKFPEAVSLGDVPNLPANVDVLENGETVSTPVTWSLDSHALSAADFSKPGPITVQMTLPNYHNKVQSVKLVVIPDNTLYFVNAGGYATPDYNLIASYMQDTLANKGIVEQAYNQDDTTPWGYLGTNSAPSGSTSGDIFSTVRYLNGGNVANSAAGTDLSYKFTLENGSYDVYLGFNDPWTNTSRKANLLFNDTVKGAVTFTPSNVMAYTGVNITDGSLNVTVRNTAAQDPMISWIMIVKPDLEPAVDTSMGLKAEAASSTSVKLTWNKTTGSLGYNLYRAESEDGTYSKVYSGSAGSYTDTGLPSEHTYFYKVSVIDGTGTESVLSNVQSVAIARTAQEVADGITAIAAPARNATVLTLPEVPAEFTTTILSSDSEVISTEGVITPPATDTTVNLILRVTRTSDSSMADTVSIAVVVPAKSSQGNSGSGSSPTSGLTPVVTTDLARLTVNGVLDVTTKVVKGAVTAEELNKAILLAPVLRSGEKVVEIELPQVAGAVAYEQQIPAANLVTLGQEQVIRIKTKFGTVTLPAGMFSATELGSAQNVTLHIGTAETSTVDKPVIEVSMLADNKPLAFHNENVGVVVTIPYTPAAGEDLDHLVILYVKDDGTTEPMPSGRYDQAVGAMVFTTTHFSKYAVAVVHKTFNDLANVHWAKAQIEALASRGIINGTSAQAYSPNTAVTRADFMKLLVSTLGLTAQFNSNFADVQSTDYYYEAIGIAKKLGITNGIGDNQFDPRASISRQDMMTLTAKALVAVQKLAAMNGTADDISGYADADQVSAYASDSIATLVKNGIVQGSGKSLSPLATTTRAEVAVMLYNIYKK